MRDPATCDPANRSASRPHQTVGARSVTRDRGVAGGFEGSESARERDARAAIHDGDEAVGTVVPLVVGDPRQATVAVARARVRLRGTAPRTWREFGLPAYAALSRLHPVIQSALGWEMRHPYGFQGPHDRCGDVRAERDRPFCDQDVREVRPFGFADRAPFRLVYTCGLGTEWIHEVASSSCMGRPSGALSFRVAWPAPTRPRRRPSAAATATGICAPASETRPASLRANGHPTWV